VIPSSSNRPPSEQPDPLDELYTGDRRESVTPRRPRPRVLAVAGGAAVVALAELALLPDHERSTPPPTQVPLPAAVPAQGPIDCRVRVDGCATEEYRVSLAPTTLAPSATAPTSTGPALSAASYPPDCRLRPGGCFTEEYRVGRPPETVPGALPDPTYPPDCRAREGGCTTEEYRVQVPPEG
jgi:hypothetical protein